jgi:uncharacterized membrane protein
MKHQLLISTALTALLAAGLSSTSFADNSAKEKCYGISKAAQNDCANLAGTHSCAGMAKTDNDIGEWQLVAKGTCVNLGGYSKAEAEEKLKQQNTKQ